MGRIIIIAALTVALIRMGDAYLYSGKYTDAAILMVREILRSFGL
jgi:hypothetical protein